MSERVDELFGAAGTEARPRSALIVGLTAAGLLTTVAGMACSVLPGVALVLLAWVVAQRELDRVDSGFLPVSDRRWLLGLRWAVWAALGFATWLTALQLVGLWTGAYQSFWSGLVEAWVQTHDPIPVPGAP
jgi:hypothetical protein